MVTSESYLHSRESSSSGSECESYVVQTDPEGASFLFPRLGSRFKLGLELFKRRDSSASSCRKLLLSQLWVGMEF